ncbi:YkgJ family cysteine cluster protein [Desulfobacterales bacterium HSG2]|nr:YkgJ family cysteine cluster protein [Desulfobacterales bacterium HSG2]
MDKQIFNCKKCGDCCKGYGGTFVTAEDVEAIAAYIKTDPERFVADYCDMSGGKPVLAQGGNGYCIFWDEVCTIHPVKPRMCRAWPFIESVLTDINNWHIMAGVCPGIRTDVPDDVIRACVREKVVGV